MLLREADGLLLLKPRFKVGDLAVAKSSGASSGASMGARAAPMHALVLAALLLRSTALAPVASRRALCERAGAAAAAAWTAARPR